MLWTAVILQYSPQSQIRSAGKFRIGIRRRVRNMILGKTQNKIHCRSDLLLNSDQDSMQNSIHDHCKTLNGFVIRTRTASPHHALPGLVLVRMYYVFLFSKLENSGCALADVGGQGCTRSTRGAKTQTVDWDWRALRPTNWLFFQNVVISHHKCFFRKTSNTIDYSRVCRHCHTLFNLFGLVEANNRYS